MNMRILFVGVFLYLAATPVFSDEGMFLKNQIPYDTIKYTYGVELSPSTVDRVSDAVFKVSIGGGGGSGSFVSPDGLVLTNHHVAYDCVQDLRKQGKLPSTTPSFAGDFFYASDLKDELPCEQYALLITRSITDVTKEVSKAIPATGTRKQKEEALKTITKKLVSQCEGLDPALSQEAFANKQDQISTVCKVSKLSSLDVYLLEKQDVIRDVRLVYAPSKKIASLGGDALNFQYPRASADFAFLRAYGPQSRKMEVGPNLTYGKVKEISNAGRIEKRFVANPTNKPLDTSPIFLKPEIRKPVGENDFVFIMGYPGHTNRVRSHFSIDLRVNQIHPFQISSLKAMEKVVSARIQVLPGLVASIQGQAQTIATAINNESDPEKKKALSQQHAQLKAQETTLNKELAGLKSNRASIMNSIQAHEATLEGLVRIKLLDKKEAIDRRLQEAIDNDPVLTQKHSTVLTDLKRIYGVLNQTNPSSMWLGTFLGTGILALPYQIVFLVEALDTNSPDPAPSHLVPRYKMYRNYFIQKAQKDPTDMDVSIAVLAAAIQASESFDLPAIKALVSGIPNHDTLSVKELASKIVTSAVKRSKVFKDMEARKALFAMPYAQLHACGDGLIELAVQLKEALRHIRKKAEVFSDNILKYRTRYYRALIDVLEEPSMNYYDANFSLRFTYGAVKGYSETVDDKTYHQPFEMSFEGIRKAFLVGKPVCSHLNPQENAFCKTAEALFGDTPVNFVSNTDITGGNSGSPVVNKDLKVVGTAFDSNWVGVVQDYTYDANSGRSVSVSLPFAVRWMNLDATGGINGGNPDNYDHRIGQELVKAER